ncbi:hypothetical protein ABZ897_06145 [Nonomuraea sp. NPDC046802]|uniref:hypothetical protein n=1 Tax=Nonomuraea sp. NPDC046802 TaxID=3154919 RepID=UPI0033D6DE98
MKLRRYRLLRISRLRFPLGRSIVVALALGVLVAALAGAADPYRQTREFREVVACERASGDCFDKEPVTIVDLSTYTTTSTTTTMQTDVNGNTHMSTTTTTDTHHMVTWQRADGSQQSRDMTSTFYSKAKKGEPAALRFYRGELVGVEVTGGAEWFLPYSGAHLALWLFLAYFGLGILLWGLFGWWDEFFLLVSHTFSWMFMGAPLLLMTTYALAYGLATGAELVIQIGIVLLFSVPGAVMLVSSLND